MAFWAVVEYGGLFGPDKASEWVVAMCLSLFTDILLLQPVKILILAAVYALIIKNPTADEDVEEHMMLRNDETYVRPQKLSAYEKKELEKKKKAAEELRKDYIYLPPDPDQLRQARELRMKELAMWRIIKEVASYTIFLYMIMFVAYNNVDGWAWQMQEASRFMVFDGKLGDVQPARLLSQTPSEGIYSMHQVASQGDIFKYLNNTLLPSLLDHTWYNGEVDELKSFTKDKAILLTGIIRLRQVRVSHGGCRLVRQFRHPEFFRYCHQEYSIFEQEVGNFSRGWNEITNETEKLNEFGAEYWRYQSMLDTGSTPSQGIVAMYDGGGYVVELPKSLIGARFILNELWNSKWIDDKTRAVFIEFNLYNPARSLFAVCMTIFELPATGGIQLYPYLYILKMQSYNTGGELMALVVQLVTLLVVIVQFVRECMKARRMRRTYWTDFWCVIDFVHLLSCIIWAGLFAARYFAFKVVSGTFKDNRTNYTNMDLIVQYDFVVTAFAAAIVAVGTFRFIRLLRFDRNIMTMLATLRYIQGFLAGFLVVFLALYFAFACFGYLAFNSNLYGYSTFITSLETLFAMALGNFDAKSLERNYGTLGPIFFSLYSFMISIVMTNFLIAFIVVGYEQAYRDDTLTKEEAAVFSFMWLKMKKMLGIAPARESSLAIDRKFKYTDDMNDDEIERFTERMEELMERIDKHLETTKQQFPNMFDQKTLAKHRRQVYITE